MLNYSITEVNVITELFLTRLSSLLSTNSVSLIKYHMKPYLLGTLLIYSISIFFTSCNWQTGCMLVMDYHENYSGILLTDWPGVKDQDRPYYILLIIRI